MVTPLTSLPRGEKNVLALPFVSRESQQSAPVKQPVTVQQPITSHHDSSLWPVFRNSLINGKSDLRPCSFRYKQCEWSLEKGILFNPDLLEKGFICNYSSQMVINMLQCPTTRSDTWIYKSLIRFFRMYTFRIETKGLEQGKDKALDRTLFDFFSFPKLAAHAFFLACPWSFCANFLSKKIRLRAHPHQASCSVPCRSANVPPPQTSAGLHSRCRSPNHARARIPPSHSTSRLKTSQALFLSVVSAPSQHSGGQLRERDNHFTDFAAVESLCLWTAAFKWLQTGMFALAIGCVHVACLCMCMSHCTVPEYTSSNRAGSVLCLRTTRSSHTSQTNRTLGVKRAWARYGMPCVSAP